MLYHWGVKSHDIINATRASLRVKNRRRQTIGNLGKLEKIEEAFEGASKAVKRTFLMRRRTGDKVKMMQQQAKLAARVGALKVSGNTECRSAPSQVCDHSDGDILESMQVSVSDFCRSSPAEAMIRGTSSGDNDAASCASGITLSNSTTASQLDIESFYRELELEMFGDEELPSFVGQTLEVPEFDIPEEERVYYYRTTEGASQGPPSITSTIPTYQDGMDDARATSCFNNLRRDEGSPQGPLFITSTNPTQQDDMHDARPTSYVNLSREGVPAPLDLEVKLPMQHAPGVVTPRHCPGQIHEFSPQEPVFNRVVQGTYPVQEHPAMEHQSEGVTEQQYMQRAQVLPSTAFQIINTKAYANVYSQRHGQESDGPQVRYVPPPAHLSPTNWMDDHESPRIRRTYVPIEISEDDVDELDNTQFVEVTEQPYMDVPAFDYLRQLQQPVAAVSFY
jgi:hypothetical protein